MRYLFDLAYLSAAIAFSPKAVYRMLRHNRYRSGWANRLGKISRKNPDKKCIWIHAVSVGEVNAAKTLITALAAQLPDYEIALSSTTDTGYERATQLYKNNITVFHFPLDFSFTMKRAFKNIKPAICLLMELEVWPNLISIAKKLDIPVVILNGRISDRSFPKYRLIKPIMKKIFQKTALILAQSDEYAKRFRALGAPQQIISVTGSLKYDTAQITDKIEGADTLAEKLNISAMGCPSAKHNQRLWVAGATGPGEEKIILNVYSKLKQEEKFSDLRLAIVPRKPERFNEVAQIITETGFDLVRYSQVKDNPSPLKTNSRTVILGDTMGDLRKFYSLATVIFVGRSLVPMGGSDMTEAAALSKCTIFGPHTFNFRQTVNDLLKDNGAIEVKDEQQMLETMKKCLSNPAYAKEIARNGQNVIRKNQGATQRTIEQIKKLLAEQVYTTID